MAEERFRESRRAGREALSPAKHARLEKIFDRAINIGKEDTARLPLRMHSQKGTAPVIGYDLNYVTESRYSWWAIRAPAKHT